MKELEQLDLHERIILGVRRGVARALAKHKQNGQSIVIWRDGKIVEIPPDQIEVDEELVK